MKITLYPTNHIFDCKDKRHKWHLRKIESIVKGFFGTKLKGFYIFRECSVCGAIEINKVLDKDFNE